MSSSKVFEGVFGISKPGERTSNDVVQHLKKAFNKSDTFKPWLEQEKQRIAEVQQRERRRRKPKHIDVKIGHGGTLDPMATGVLIIGVGKGTKSLSSFLECTKSYETTVLFGGATDTYDVTGKLLGRAPHAHITREKVEEALKAFRGEIMQKPPIFSALRMDGKRLYEYAREGKTPPKEIVERPVRVDELEIVSWLEPGTHAHQFPEEEAPENEKEVAGKLLNITAAGQEEGSSTPQAEGTGEKRKRSDNDEDTEVITDERPPSKRQETDSQSLMSGALATPSTEDEVKGPDDPAPSDDHHKYPTGVVIRMTVSSGFYVRSLCHDLGKAVGSLAAMATLVRSRQGDFKLDKNCLDFDDVGKGEEVWGPKVQNMLDEWNRDPTPPRA